MTALRGIGIKIMGLHPWVFKSILGYISAVNDREFPILGSLRGICIKIRGLHPCVIISILGCIFAVNDGQVFIGVQVLSY